MRLLVVALLLMLLLTSPADAGNLSDDRDMWLRYYNGADGSPEALMVTGWTSGAVGALSYLTAEGCGVRSPDTFPFDRGLLMSSRTNTLTDTDVSRFENCLRQLRPLDWLAF